MRFWRDEGERPGSKGGPAGRREKLWNIRRQMVVLESLELM